MAKPRAPALLDVVEVQRAARRLKGKIERTPTRLSQVLSALTGATVYLKFENQQFTSSFKERGALNRLLQLSQAQKRAGVIAVSAGNHAQAVAYHSQRLGVRATIVMPETTPFAKVTNTETLGAEVVLFGQSLSEAMRHGREIGAKRGLTLIHPYDDPLVVAGQGTVALELLHDVPDLDDIVIPTGGGGLLAGVAVAAKALAPRVRVLGVQSQSYTAIARWFYNKKLSDSTEIPETIAEGIAVKDASELTRAHIRKFVDEILTVKEVRIEAAINLLLELEKTVVEGAGAAGLAAVLAKPQFFADRKVGVVLTGGNIDQRTLAEIILRGLARSGRLNRMSVDAKDLPGTLASLTQTIARAGGNIVDVQHQRVFSGDGARTKVEFDVATRDKRHADHVMRMLTEAGHHVELLQR